MKNWIAQARGAPLVGDVLVVAVVTWITSLDAWYNVEGTRQADAITWGVVALSITALVFRRRWPLPAALRRMEEELDNLDRSRRTYLAQMRTLIARQLSEVEASDAAPAATPGGRAAQTTNSSGPARE